MSPVVIPLHYLSFYSRSVFTFNLRSKSLIDVFFLSWFNHYIDVIMGAILSQITSLTIVYLTVYSSADQRKHQSSVSLSFVRGIYRWQVNSLHKWSVTRQMLSFDDVIMNQHVIQSLTSTAAVLARFSSDNIRFSSMASSRGVFNYTDATWATQMIFREAVHSQMVCSQWLICSVICVRN